MEKENNVNSNGQNYYLNIKGNRFFDRSGNEWKFLAEVSDLAHCKMICAQHGVQCPIKRSAYCVQLNCMQFVWFKKSKGCKGFDCPYRLLLIRQKQVAENCCFGKLFQRGEHSHPFIPECMCLKFWGKKICFYYSRNCWFRWQILEEIWYALQELDIHGECLWWSSIERTMLIVCFAAKKWQK